METIRISAVSYLNTYPFVLGIKTSGELDDIELQLDVPSICAEKLKAGMVDLAGETTRLEKELKEARSHIERLEKLLSSDFASKAPPALVQKEREKLDGYRKTAEKIEAQLA